MQHSITLREGELVAGRFVVERLAGLGGMGAVYRALDLETKTRAAVKVIARQRSTSGERFLREAQVLAKLNHPSIVRYIAHGTTTTHALFLAMEWLDGEDLAARLSSHGLDLQQTFSLMRRICEGLAVAHRQGVVHRDVKPSNIFLPDGDPARAVLLDFGVARQEAMTRPLTHAGAVVGTVGYMAPEQAMGAFDVDARVDVFALGCVLYELLTGRAAFAAQHDVAVLAKVLREDPPLVSELRPELGVRADALLMRMLAKDREMRPRDMDALLRALDDVDASVADAPRIARPPRSRGLVESEQRIVSVILGRGPRSIPETMPVEHAARDAESIDQLLALFDAEATPLAGGGVLLVLGASGAANASDQAVQAARCALRLRHLRPDLILGVATGAVETTAHIPVGAAIDRAAALLEGTVAMPGVAVDELTAGLLGSLFDVQDVQGVRMLVAELDDSETPRMLMGKVTPCVGRDKELALLEATLCECVEDEVARAVLVTAPPGVGKSRLGHEFLERARGRAVARVLMARAEPASAGSALGLMRRLLRSALGLRAGDGAAQQQARVRSYLESHEQGELPGHRYEFLCELLDVPLELGVSPLLRTARGDPEVMREQTRRALEAWLDVESTRRPLVLVVEDLHWGDLASVTCLGELLRRFEDRPIMLLALARSDVRESFPALWSGLKVQELQLHGLTRRAAERLVSATLSADTSPSLVARIVELAEGNAFYLEELIRRAAEGGTEFPETVVAMAQSRLSGLVSDARRTLRAASVLGEASWASAVQTLLGEEETATESLLDDLVREEILQVRPQSRFSGQREYVFRHAFLRDAAYGMLSPTDRGRAHRAAGEWLAEHGEKDARVLADHFELGAAPQLAVPWLVRAALDAVEAGDFATSKLLSHRGRALGASGHHRGALLLVAANADAWGSKPELEPVSEALGLLPHASSAWWLAVSVLIFGSSAKGDAEAAARYMKLAATTPPGPELTGFYGQALATLASASVLLGQTDLGWSLVRRHDDIASDDPSCDRMFLTWRDIARSHVALYAPVDGRWQLEQAIGWARASAAAMATVGSTQGESLALFMLGKAWLFVGAYEDAEAALQKSVNKAVQAGNDVVREFSNLILSRLAVHRGRADDALAALERAPTSDHNIAHGYQCVRAEVCYLRGEFEHALRLALACAAGSTAPSRRMAWATVARSYYAMGRDADALEAVGQAFQHGDAMPDLEFEIDLRNTRVRAFLRRGEHEAARTELRHARDLLQQVATPIVDERLRQLFLGGIEPHRQLAALAREWLPKSHGSRDSFESEGQRG